MTDKQRWVIDQNHSQVQFKVKHLAVSNVAGHFNVFKGEVLSEPDSFNDAAVQCTIDVGSIDTNNAQRDNDLRSPHFLDAEKFPAMSFDGKLRGKNDDYELSGTLTIKDTTVPVTMAATFSGTGKGRFSDTRAGFEAQGKISRKDFGLAWNILTEAGGLIIGDEIKLSFDIQLILQP